MDLLRSEPMQLVQLIIPMESAYRTVSYLGDLGLFQFKDVIDFLFTLLFINFFLYLHSIINRFCYVL